MIARRRTGRARAEAARYVISARFLLLSCNMPKNARRSWAALPAGCPGAWKFLLLSFPLRSWWKDMRRTFIPQMPAHPVCIA